MAKKNACSQPCKTVMVAVVWCGFFCQGGFGSCFEKSSVLIILRILYILVSPKFMNLLPVIMWLPTFSMKLRCANSWLP